MNAREEASINVFLVLLFAHAMVHNDFNHIFKDHFHKSFRHSLKE